MEQIKRIIPLEEVANHSGYADLDKLAMIFNHDVVETDMGIWRWKKNNLVDLLFRNAPFYEGTNYSGSTKTCRGCVDLNHLWMDLHKNVFSMEEMIKFYMGSGYSLSGFIAVFCREASEFNLPGAIPINEDSEEPTQDIIDYMITKYDGQVLKL